MCKIAILSDIHGNITALEAILVDAMREVATDYWILGDLIMIGPGTSEIIEQIKNLPNVVFVKGNWDDVFLNTHSSDFSDPTNVYGGRIAKYQYERISENDLTFIKNLPSIVIKEVAGYEFLLCHHLPYKNYGHELWPSQKQENFDLLFADHKCDVAIYGHMHRQLMRYSSEGQLIINPGSIYVPTPFSDWEKQSLDLRPQYAIIEVDYSGIDNIKFKKVDYDIDKEIALAKERVLPYLNFYEESLKTGRSFTHNKELLKKTNAEYGYDEEVIAFFKPQQLHK